VNVRERLGHGHRPGQRHGAGQGADHAHVGLNKGTEPVELYLTYLLPPGAPLSTDAPTPRC
jgi:hypothetical protein